MNESIALPQRKDGEGAPQTTKVDVLLASDLDIAFCLRFAQLRRAMQRSCIVLINSENLDWRAAEAFKQTPNLQVAVDQESIAVESHKTYFSTIHYSLKVSTNQLILRRTNNESNAFIDSIDTLLQDNRLEIGDLLVLKTSAVQHRATQWEKGIEHFWYESQTKTPAPQSSDSIIQRLTRPEMMQRLCTGYRQVSASYSQSTTENYKSLIPDLKNADKSLGGNGDTIKDQVFEWLQRQSSIDYSDFRQSWLVSIMESRATEVGCTTVSDYMKWCESRHGERCLDRHFFTSTPWPKGLLHTLNTAPTVFDVLLSVMPTQAQSFRIWVAGCGLGEAAYALGMTWEHTKYAYPDIELKLLASDISEHRIHQASLGLHKECVDVLNAESDQISAILKEPFGDFHSVPSIRKHIVFAQHDLRQSPPYTQLNLIVCQNTFPPYKESVHQSILSMFNRSLMTGGLLWLGAEDVKLVNPIAGSLGFEEVTGLQGIYRKVNAAQQNVQDFLQTASKAKRKHFAPSLNNLLRSHERYNRYSNYHHVLDRLIDVFMLPGILIDTDCRLLHTLGDVSEYLMSSTQGKFSADVKLLFKHPLRDTLPHLLEELFELEKDKVFKTLWANADGDSPGEFLNVHLLFSKDDHSGQIIGAVLFEKETAPLPEIADTEEFQLGNTLDTQFRYIQQLEADLSQTHSDSAKVLSRAQQKIEDLTAVNAEVTYANQQTQAINEQLAERYEALRGSYEESKSEEDLWQTYFDNIAVGIVIIGSDLKSKYINNRGFNSINELFNATLIPGDKESWDIVDLDTPKYAEVYSAVSRVVTQRTPEQVILESCITLFLEPLSNDEIAMSIVEGIAADANDMVEI